jgi:periplasmic protein TonB
MKNFIIFIFFAFTVTNSVAQNTTVEKSAEFPGGLSKFYKYLGKNIKYPKDARKKGISGTLYVSFVINSNGEVDKDLISMVSKEELMSQIGQTYASDAIEDESLELEAKRVIRNSPKWIPGTQDDIPVRQRMLLPVIFKK